MKVLVVFGTRPEAIKMCPLILELKSRKGIECIVCLTGQHRNMLKPIMDCFGISENYNLNIMKNNQSLTDITTGILERMQKVLITEKPDVVLVHGDTTTSFAAALAAFYQKISVGHVEAGLRTGNRYSPYPEELNRSMTARIATYHFAPTEKNRDNLIKENIYENVYVTGNTIIDSFKTTIKESYVFHNKLLKSLKNDCKYVLLTAHRRENLGQPLKNICNAVVRITEENNDIKVIYPVHPNPKVREIVCPLLSNREQIILTDPVDVSDMHNLMKKCYLVMTDSGGLQEEAPALHKPVIVLRKETERPEAITNGTAVLAGIDEEQIYLTTRNILRNKDAYEKMSKASNPYGDGTASAKIVDILKGSHI